MYARKPVIHFGDKIAQCPGYSKLSRLSKVLVTGTRIVDSANLA